MKELKALIRSVGLGFADCVEKFQGGVVLVSHDQYFVSRVARDVRVVADGAVELIASFDAYKQRERTRVRARESAAATAAAARN